MGFLRKRKKQNQTQEIETTEVSAEELTNTANEDDEDDFSPVTKTITREEFKKAAAENLIESLQDQQNDDTAQATEDSEPEQDVEDDTEKPSDEEISDVQENEENISAADDTEEKDEAETSQPNEAPEHDDEDDFSIAEEQDNTPLDSEESEEPLKKEKKPRKSFKELCAEHPAAVKYLKITGIGLCIVILAIYIYGCCTVPVGKMGRNVYIENVNISNLTYDEALKKVRNTTLLDNQEITLVCNGKSFSINGADVGLTPRIEDTVDKAMRYGKTNNIFIDGLANALQLFSKHTVVPNANVNEEFLRTKINSFGVQVYGELVEHKLEVGDNVIICTPGHTGFDGNTDAAYKEIIKAIDNEQFHNIRVTLRAGKPRTYTAQDIDNFAYCNPIIAWFHYQDNNVTIVPEIPGRYLDIEETTRLVSQLREGGPVIKIPYYTSTADITAEMLQAKLFNATLASYTTNYGGSTSNRCANIKNAASKIDGKVLAPGEVFSFNDTVGKRSAANGFFTATEYANGEAIEGIGGGTCQVSSTLYNAVLYSDLSIVARTEHMFAVNYCPLGQDATVADSGVDFKFVNNMDYPIKISATTTGHSITISIIGTQRDDPRTVKIVNSAKSVGGGTSVQTVRKVYNSAGDLIRTENLRSSYYMAH